MNNGSGREIVPASSAPSASLLLRPPAALSLEDPPSSRYLHVSALQGRHIPCCSRFLPVSTATANDLPHPIKRRQTNEKNFLSSFLASLHSCSSSLTALSALFILALPILHRGFNSQALSSPTVPTSNYVLAHPLESWTNTPYQRPAVPYLPKALLAYRTLPTHYVRSLEGPIVSFDGPIRCHTKSNAR